MKSPPCCPWPECLESIGSDFARAAETGQKIRRLEAVGEMLLHTASCPERDHCECQNFQCMLRMANEVKTRKLTPAERQGSNSNDVLLQMVKPITDWWR